MTTRKGFNRLRINAILFLTLSTVCMASACSNTQSEAAPEATTPIVTPAETSNNNSEPAPTAATEANDLLIPEGATVTKVIKEITMNNNYRKKVELLSDGGKLVTISNSKGEIVMRNLEYDGIIKKVDGRTVTVEIFKGEEMTLTIPDNLILEDEDNLGLNSGVEIEWVINANGQIESVELDD